MGSDDIPPETRGKRRHYSAPALEKGLDILELLAGASGALNLSQIARRMDRSVGEIFRMLVVLDQRGYVRMIEGTDDYTITLKLLEQAHRIPEIDRLGRIASTALRKLAADTGQSCHLAVHYEGHAHIVVQEDAPSERFFRVRLGAVAPLIDSCSGHVLLAFATKADRSMMVERIPPGQRSPTRAELDELVARVTAQGHELLPSRQVQGITDIGYPIFGHTGHIAAALVIPFLRFLDNSHPVSLDEAQNRAAETAASISIALGARQPANASSLGLSLDTTLSTSE